MNTQSVLVTGASRGIGNAIASRLLKDGFSVIGTKVKTEFGPGLTNNAGFKGITCDLSDEKEIISRIKPLFKNSPPGVIINNAGIFRDALFHTKDDEWLDIWDQTMQVNLRSVALISKWAVEAWLSKDQKGIIINIASRAAMRGDTAEYAAYAASKGGMVAFTKSLARSFGKDGITAYSIAPGFVKTDMAENSISVYGEEYLTKDSVLGEIAPPEEVANLVSLLASGKLKHATGSTFHVNSGSFMI